MPLNLAGGRGTRIPDLTLLFAVHAARQATAPTARIMRSRDHLAATNDEPDRLTLIFTTSGASPAVRHRASGPFNKQVAALLAVGNDGEGGVYLGV